MAKVVVPFSTVSSSGGSVFRFWVLDENFGCMLIYQSGISSVNYSIVLWIISFALRATGSIFPTDSSISCKSILSRVVYEHGLSHFDAKVELLLGSSLYLFGSGQLDLCGVRINFYPHKLDEGQQQYRGES